MAQPLRVGIIGAGWAGSGHAAAYCSVPGVTLAGLWSRTRARAEALAHTLDRPALRVYDRWENMIEQGELDVVSIAAPPVLRRAPIATGAKSIRPRDDNTGASSEASRRHCRDGSLEKPMEA